MKFRNTITGSISALALASTCLSYAPAAQAQDAVDDAAHGDAADAAQDPSTSVVVSPKNPFDDPKFLAFISKVFGDTESEPVDPSRLALAEETVGALLPPGAYSEMMNELIDLIAIPLMEEIPPVTLTDIWLTTGVEVAKDLEAEELLAIAAIIAPDADQNAKQVLTLSKKFMAQAMDILEPPVRSGMARAYARRFNAKQLNEMNTFFATPTGGMFAAESMKLQMDPEVMRSLFAAMPDILESLKKMGPEITAEAKSLDRKSKVKVSELDYTQQKELADLLGVSVKELREKAADVESIEDADPYAAEATDAAEGAMEASQEIGEEPWYDPDNWVPEDRKREQELSDTYDEKYDASTASYADWRSAFDQAVANARKRMKKKK